ncbi:MAG: GNAT family N-acetyltransferase [Ktedonobacterales bacterium]
MTNSTKTNVIPAGYAARPPEEADMPAVIALLAAHDKAHLGFADPLSAEDIHQDWQRLDLARDAWALVTPEGELAAYATLFDEGYGQLWADGYVKPPHYAQGLGTAVVRLTEARARALVASAPEGARVVLANNVILSDEPARHLLEREGYALARCFWRMQIDLADAPPAPEWPSGVTMRSAVTGRDERAVFECVEESFADHWGHVPQQFEHWIERTSRADFDPALWLLAEEGGQLAGVALCRRQLAGGWVNMLAVRRPWRRRGLGMALLRHAFGELYRRGERTVGLGVDASSLTGATRLYERAGMRISAQFARYEKELRAGEDLSTQALDE